jgi:hypothetical protein
MFRFSRLIAVLAVCAIVTAALAKAIKIREITPLPGTLEYGTDADGMAIFNYHDGQNNNSNTEATVAITDFVPGETYGAWVTPGGDVSFAEVANPAGNATFHGFFTSDLCLWNEVGITVTIWREQDGTYGRATDGSEDVAEGFAPCP